ncbi:MAG: hypothetical protein LBD80_04980 [Tannerella sp.]|jgi:hypothetical protein|nr:hypothetical protein [Tannerella sp.]
MNRIFLQHPINTTKAARCINEAKTADRPSAILPRPAYPHEISGIGRTLRHLSGRPDTLCIFSPALRKRPDTQCIFSPAVCKRPDTQCIFTSPRQEKEKTA